MKTFLGYIAEAGHLCECASHDVDGPNADAACDCGLDRIARATRHMPDSFVALIETVIDLGECVALIRPVSGDLRGRYQRSAHAVEVAALTMASSHTTLGEIVAMRRGRRATEGRQG